MKTNAEWHAKHPMPPRATLDVRAKWHAAHARHCGCRPVPASLAARVKATGRAPKSRAR
jgi:hypothetical protein